MYRHFKCMYDDMAVCRLRGGMCDTPSQLVYLCLRCLLCVCMCQHLKFARVFSIVSQQMWTTSWALDIFLLWLLLSWLLNQIDFMLKSATINRSSLRQYVLLNSDSELDLFKDWFDWLDLTTRVPNKYYFWVV